MTISLKDLGEDGLIRLLSSRFGEGLPPGVTGIGDDCAVIPGAGDERWLVSTDLLVEGVHFLRESITPGDLGHRALAVNLSDLAAMGAEPHSAYVSLALPGELDLPWVEALLDGIQWLARQNGALVLGGDTTGSRGPVVINLAVVGRADGAQIKYRHGAQAGDTLCVTGPLGDSAAGLILQGRAGLDADEAALVRRHHRPTPRLAEGRWLAAQGGVTAMMDLSDGLTRDLPRLAEASSCGARVELSELPISGELGQVASARSWDASRMAATGGEDYQLLCAVQADALPALERDFEADFGRPLAAIGRTLAREQGVSYWAGSERVELSGEGFEHFDPE